MICKMSLNMRFLKSSFSKIFLVGGTATLARNVFERKVVSWGGQSAPTHWHCTRSDLFANTRAVYIQGTATVFRLTPPSELTDLFPLGPSPNPTPPQPREPLTP